MAGAQDSVRKCAGVVPLERQDYFPQRIAGRTLKTPFSLYLPLRFTLSIYWKCVHAKDNRVLPNRAQLKF
jgi:hypothetical protein